MNWWALWQAGVKRGTLLLPPLLLLVGRMKEFFCSNLSRHVRQEAGYVVCWWGSWGDFLVLFEPQAFVPKALVVEAYHWIFAKLCDSGSLSLGIPLISQLLFRAEVAVLLVGQFWGVVLGVISENPAWAHSSSPFNDFVSPNPSTYIVLAHSGCSSRIPYIGWFKQEMFIFHTSACWQVQYQGASRFSV